MTPKRKRKKTFNWICRLIENNEFEKAKLKIEHPILTVFDRVGLRAWLDIKLED